MNTQVCTRCGQEKGLAFFHNMKASPTGKAYRCRECCREVDSQRNKSPERKAKTKEWWHSEEGKRWNRERQRRCYAEKQDRIRAWVTIKDLIKKDIIKPLPCQVCEVCPTSGHHPDYSKPLEVVWLCQKHHTEVHRSLTT